LHGSAVAAVAGRSADVIETVLAV